MLSIQRLWKVVDLNNGYITFRNCEGKTDRRGVSIFLGNYEEVKKEWSRCAEPGREELDEIQDRFVQGIIDDETLERATEEIMAHLSRLNEPTNCLPAGLVSAETVPELEQTSEPVAKAEHGYNRPLLKSARARLNPPA